MLAVQTIEANTLKFLEVPLPRLSAGQVMVEIHHATLCGTDLHIFEDDYTTKLPIVQGHELAGIVVARGEGVAGVEVGLAVAIDPLSTCEECAACRQGRGNVCPRLTVLGCYGDGGLTEFIVVEADRVHAVPAGLPLALAAVAEPAAISLEAVTRGRAGRGELALVLGAGPIGLLATLALKDRGLKVIAADTVAERLNLAQAFGADTTVLVPAHEGLALDEVAALARQAGHPDGPELVIEATGVPASLTSALHAVAPAGRVVQVGISTRPTGFPLHLLPFKEVDLLGSRNSQGLLPDALKMIGKHRERVAALLTHRFPVRELAAAFDALRTPEEKVGKVLIDMPAAERSAAAASREGGAAW